MKHKSTRFSQIMVNSGKLLIIYTVTCISCNMGRRDLPDMYARGLRAYISGKSRLHMLQLICNTSVYKQ